MESKRDKELNRIKKINSLKKHTYSSLASSKEGRLFLYFMMKDCGYNAPSIVMNGDKTVNYDAVIINETLRNFYLNIRKFIPTELLKEIEYLDIENQLIEGEKTNGTK